MNDSKYVVFKREDFLAWFALRSHGVDLGDMPPALEDAVVIRRQDVFAPPALDAYANNIQSAVEAIKATGVEPHGLAERLTEIADYFHDQASEAWLTVRKLPD